MNITKAASLGKQTIRLGKELYGKQTPVYLEGLHTIEDDNRTIQGFDVARREKTTITSLKTQLELISRRSNIQAARIAFGSNGMKPDATNTTFFFGGEMREDPTTTAQVLVTRNKGIRRNPTQNDVVVILDEQKGGENNEIRI